MATNNNFNISKIESYIYGIVRQYVTEHTYVGSLPDVIKDNWSDMCYIDCSNVISDNNACAKGTILLFIYARPLSDGTKNVKKMSELEIKVNKMIDETGPRETNYRITRTGTYTDYDSNRQWHCNIVELNIIIS